MPKGNALSCAASVVRGRAEASLLQTFPPGHPISAWMLVAYDGVFLQGREQVHRFFSSQELQFL